MNQALGLHGKRLLTASILKGTIRKREENRLELEGAKVLLQPKTKEWIPVLLDPPSKNVLHVTSGSPESALFPALYLLDSDTIVQVHGDADLRIRADSAGLALSGSRCIIELVSQYYRTRFNPRFRRFDKQHFPRAPVGWLSWYCFYNDFDEEKCLRIAEFAARHFKDFGFQYVLLETWQRNSHKLPCKDYYNDLNPDTIKFPRGLRKVTDELHRRGLKAGLWVVPLGTGEREFFEKHPRLHIVNQEGKPLDHWSGRYVLDPTIPEAKRYIAGMIRTIIREWQFDYLKIDGLELGTDYAREFFDEPHNRALLANEEEDPFRNILELLRGSMGNKTFFLACGAEITAASRCPGLVHGARVGKDVFYEGDPTWGAVLHTAQVITNALHLHNIAWYNDPDVLSIREPLSLEHAKLLCTIVGLTGQLLFLGDILYELAQERVEMLQKLMPVCDIYPGHLAHNEELQPIWNLCIRRPFEQWNLVGLFNWGEKESERIVLDMNPLGLDAGREYLLYDFWNRSFLGNIQGTKVFSLKPQSSLLLAVRQKTNRPQLLSIDRHITQGGVCLKDLRWRESDLSLEGRMNLPKGRSFTATLYVPAGFQLRSVHGAAELDKKDGDLLILRVQKGSWRARFARR